jgi:hypothetical protein
VDDGETPVFTTVTARLASIALAFALVTMAFLPVLNKASQIVV